MLSEEIKYNLSKEEKGYSSDKLEVPKTYIPLYRHYTRSIQIYMNCEKAKLFMYDKQPVSILIDLAAEDDGLKINSSIGIA